MTPQLDLFTGEAPPTIVRSSLTSTDYLIATCSYSAFRPEMGLPVQTSTGNARFFKHGPLAKLPEAAPFGIFGNDAYMGKPEAFKAAYLRRLDDNAEIITAKLQIIAEEFGLPPVLLCFEDLSKADKSCHRTWLGEWLESHSGLVVPELGPATSAWPGPSTSARCSGSPSAPSATSASASSSWPS